MKRSQDDLTEKLMKTTGKLLMTAFAVFLLALFSFVATILYLGTKPQPQDEQQPGETLVSADATIERETEIPDTARRYQDRSGLLVVVDKKNYKLSLWQDGKVRKEYLVAVGKNRGDKQRPGDLRTPEGEFSVSQIQNASHWAHDFKDGKGMIEGAYGPRFIRLRTPGWTGIGIHGTHDPASLGTDATEGCIRMKNEELLELAEIIQIGTPVVIEP